MRPRAKNLRMTRQHFEAIAAVLKAEKPIFAAGAAAHEQWRRTVDKFASVCADSNDKFRADTFRAACGWES